MNILTKTPEQQEIAAIFERLEQEFKMSKAEIARQLNVERGYVGMLVKGQRHPSARTLNDFRELEAKQRATKQPGQQNELEQLCGRIALMERHDPANFQVIKTVVESLAPSNSKSASAAKRLLKKAGASVRKPVSE